VASTATPGARNIADGSFEMLVDAHWPPPPDPPQRDPRWNRLAWPVLVVMFLVAAYVTPPLVGFFCVWAALYCVVQSGASLIPKVGGLRDYKQ
jgi:hypothetical protein